MIRIVREQLKGLDPEDQVEIQREDSEFGMPITLAIGQVKQDDVFDKWKSYSFLRAEYDVVNEIYRLLIR